ncbi:hypothetical protein [Pseudomonas chlororaphis]|uniref:hypothetical protein n=1 Tax=Pseudomonas chlororaphis TaxID=587753 RepID=UPI000B0A70E4|nr:hypothetical protein [Pseudomonas chlororaphis]
MTEPCPHKRLAFLQTPVPARVFCRSNSTLHRSRRDQPAGQRLGIATDGLRSKALDEFAGQQFHYVITLCDKSSEEAARMPSSGEVIVWNFEDPVTSDKHEPFRHTLQEIHDRLHMFITVKTRS